MILGYLALIIMRYFPDYCLRIMTKSISGKSWQRFSLAQAGGELSRNGLFLVMAASEKRSVFIYQEFPAELQKFMQFRLP